VYSDRWGVSQFASNYDLIHAYGTPHADINNDGILVDFARKVVISPDKIKLPDNSYSLTKPLNFGRIKLWP
jgi:hypothetical protein